MTKLCKSLIFGIAVIIIIALIFVFGREESENDSKKNENENWSGELSSILENKDVFKNQKIKKTIPLKNALLSKGYKESLIKNGSKSYYSDELGISFTYPKGYFLFENFKNGKNNLTLMPDTEFVRGLLTDIEPRGTEWPPSISFSFFYESDRTISLDEWIMEKQFNTEDDLANPNKKIIPLPNKIAGNPTISFFIMGLYDYNTIVFEHSGWIVLSSVGFQSLEDQIVKDFQLILSTVIFKD